VRSQTSSFAFKGKPRNLHDVGKQLAADYILEGSVLRAGGQLRVNTQLVRIRDDVTLWSVKYDRELTDVFAIQAEISQGIVNSLRLKLGRGRRRYETSLEAYDLYLRARAVEREDLSPLSGSEQAIGFYQAATIKDPAFAPAHAGVALAYAFRSGTNRDDRADDLAIMRAAAERAIQLDPLSGEAQVALGVSRARDGHWEQSATSFRQAIELEPTNSMAHSYFAMYDLLPLGRIEEALDQLRIAEKTDPLSPQVHGLLGYVLTSARRYGEAAGHCQKASNRPGCLGRTLLGQGRIQDAIQMFGTSVVRVDSAFLGYAMARAGRREEAGKLLSSFASQPAQQALIYAGLADKDSTLEALNRLVAQGPIRVGRYLTFPEFDLLRGDPRVKALRKHAGLPE